MAGNYPFLIKNYTELTHDELVTVLNIRNHPDVRKWMFNSDEIDLSSHLKFIDSLHTDRSKLFYAAFDNGTFCGAFNMTGLNTTQPMHGYFSNPNITDAMNGMSVYYFGLCFFIKRCSLSAVYGSIFEGNRIARKLAAKFGATETAVADGIVSVQLDTRKWNLNFDREELLTFIIDKNAKF